MILFSGQVLFYGKQRSGMTRRENSVATHLKFFTFLCGGAHRYKVFVRSVIRYTGLQNPEQHKLKKTLHAQRLQCLFQPATNVSNDVPLGHCHHWSLEMVTQHQFQTQFPWVACQIMQRNPGMLAIFV